MEHGIDWVYIVSYLFFSTSALLGKWLKYNTKISNGRGSVHPIIIDTKGNPVASAGHTHTPRGMCTRACVPTRSGTELKLGWNEMVYHRREP